MIADFGLSKHLAELKSNSEVFGMFAYIEPQCFIMDNYKRNEKSDVYSLGVLLWEISSGRPPFSEIPSFNINLKIAKGVRESPVNNTPVDYQRLYEDCWNENPNKRPDIDAVYRVLNQLILQFNNDNDEYVEIPTTRNFSDLNDNNSNSFMVTDSNLENLSIRLNNNQNGKIEIS